MFKSIMLIVATLVLFCIIGASAKSCVSIVPQTGQTISYEAGDDGDLQRGLPWPIPRFTDNGDGTVTDNLTLLEWTKNADLYDIRVWNQALLDCSDCAVGDNTDWHLPNVRELQSLMDYSKHYPVLPDGHPFTDVKWNKYWSSTTEADNEQAAWLVHFGSGNQDAEFKTDVGFVWCVRDGQ